METDKILKSPTGITLIALVISIIVLLILVGVSINATIGENGILKQAQTATISQKLAKYKEELEFSIVGYGDNVTDIKKEKITALNDNVKKYIPSLIDEDIGKYGIIAGDLYYLSNNELEKEVCLSHNILLKEEDLAVDEFINKMENMALEVLIKEMAGESFKQTDDLGNEKEIGVKLYDKNFQNSTTWKFITEIENGNTKAVYGTDWYYVEKGTTIENIGILSESYIINYKTGKAVKFDATKHSMLAYGSFLAVQEGLIFEISPSQIENGMFDTTDASISYGGYENGIEDAFTDTSFRFDGVDDYISVAYSPENDLTKGFSFTFYGKILSEGTNYRGCGSEDETDYENCSPSPNYPTTDTTYKSDTIGVFSCWGRKKATDTTGWDAFIRFNLRNQDEKLGIMYNVGWKNKEWSSAFSNPNTPQWPWNQIVMFDDYGENVYFGDEVCYTIALDGENYTQSFYVNGQLMDSGDFNKDAYDNFIANYMNRIEYYYIGRSSADNTWHYGDMDVYGLNLYSRALSEQEVLANYNAMVTYHNTLEDSSKAETGGETGGENLEDIN